LLVLFYFCHDCMHSILRELSPRARHKALGIMPILPTSFV
jgi:hypothetical protein